MKKWMVRRMNYRDDQGEPIPGRRVPVLQESGGAFSTTGDAQIVCGSKGERLSPLCLPTKIEPCGVHAYFECKPYQYVIRVHWEAEWPTVFKTSIFRIFDIGSSNGGNFTEILVEQLLTNKRFVWKEACALYPSLPKEMQFLDFALLAAFRKSICYLCPTVYYGKMVPK
jgi:hypothetical protein